MQSKEIITAPIADAITPSGVVDKPSACGAFIFTTMKLIPLSQDKFAMVDDADFNWLNQWKWAAHKRRNNIFYAVKHNNGKSLYMHNALLNPIIGQEVDHKDHNGLNNQRSNLRSCTKAQNQYNNRVRKKSNLPRGVFKSGNKYRARIRCIMGRLNLGTFLTKELAAHAYDNAAKIYHGEFATLNFK